MYIRFGWRGDRRPGDLDAALVRRCVRGAVFNRAVEPATVAIRWADIEILGGRHARDLWAHQDLGWPGEVHAVTVPGHGVAMLQVTTGAGE